MTDESLHKQSPEDDDPQQKVSAASESPPHKSSQQSYTTLSEVAEREVRPVPKRRLSLNWVLSLLVIIVWSVAIGLYLSSLPAVPSAPSVAMEQPIEETRQPIPSRAAVETVPSAPDTVVADVPEPKTAASAPDVSAELSADGEPPAVVEKEVAEPVYRLTIGPFIDAQTQQQAVDFLRQLDMTIEQMRDQGRVRMIRLFAGSYPAAEAEQRLQRLQTAVPSAFALPDNGRRALYAASFQSRDRADIMQQALAEDGISVTQQLAEVTMTGTLLIINQVDHQAAERITHHFEDSGIQVQSEKLQP